MLRKMRRRICIFLALIVCGYLSYALLSNKILSVLSFLSSHVLSINISIFMNDDNAKKIILAWTPFFGRPMDNHYLNGCPFRNACFITDQRRQMGRASAFVYHALDIDLKDLPPARTSFFHSRKTSESQIHVFMSHEAPPNTDTKAYQLKNFFNWTMTYRMDSDVPFPYSYMIKSEADVVSLIDLNATVLGKKSKAKLIAWFASNCYTHSKREQYVAELNKYVAVDVYGRCGSLACPRDHQQDCDRLVDNEYKFYLSFENSLCLDYASEKFFGKTHLNAVPIVLKRGIVEKLFPEKSFVAADDFAHPKFLAAYLKYLDKNDSAYLEYFRWRNEGYRFDNHDENGNYFGFCGLCQRLLKKTYKERYYENIKKWWLDESQCDQELVPKLIALKNP